MVTWRVMGLRVKKPHPISNPGVPMPGSISRCGKTEHGSPRRIHSGETLGAFAPVARVPDPAGLQNRSQRKKTNRHQSKKMAPIPENRVLWAPIDFSAGTGHSMPAAAIENIRDQRKTMNSPEPARLGTRQSPKTSFGFFAAAALLPAWLLGGCMDSAPGESQEQESARTRSYTVHQTANPACAPSTHLLVLDEDAIRNTCRDAEERSRCRPGSRDSRKRSSFEKKDAHCQFSEIGYRGVVAYFAEHIGEELLIPAGDAGDEGWFAPTSVRIAWKNAGPDIGDGLRNYVEAGPGLGSPDSRGDRQSLLRNVPNLMPLRATGLARLEGSQVCAVVVD